MNKRNFKEPQALNDVADFHDLFDMPVLDEPAIPSMDRCKLRLALLEEELRELREGVETNDLREIANA